MSIYPNTANGRQHIYAMMQDSEKKPKVQHVAQQYIDQVEMFDLVISQPYYIHEGKKYFNKYNTITHGFDSKPVSQASEPPIHDPSMTLFYRRDFLISKVAAFAKDLFPADEHKREEAKEYLQHKLFGDQEWCDYLAYGRSDGEKDERLLKFCSKLVADKFLSAEDKKANRKDS